MNPEMNSKRIRTLTKTLLLALYWGASKLPASTSPGGRLWKRIRASLASSLLLEAGISINVEHGAYFGRGDQVRLGDRSGIGVNARIHGPVDIGSDVMMGPDVMIYARNHQFHDTAVPMIRQGFAESKTVVIEDDVWIGARAVILPGVTIGRGSIVAAQCVVTKSIAPYSIVAGNPGRVVRNRLDNR